MAQMEMLEERLRFLQLDQDVISELRNAKIMLEPAMDELLDRFYAHILREPGLRSLFADKDAIERARSAQKKHWLSTLFEGKFDNHYLEKAAKIGLAHFHAGLTPTWYIGGYCKMLIQFIELISKTYSESGKSPSKIVEAVSKAIFLDMDVVIHCYLDVKDSSMRQILRRATKFTSDVTALSDDLNAAASRIRVNADALSAEPFGQPGIVTSMAGKPSKPAAENDQRINDLLVQTQELCRCATLLDERLKELQFGDKLYIDESHPQSGLISRMKALIFRKN
jgi:hypothetical protein